MPPPALRDAGIDASAVQYGFKSSELEKTAFGVVTSYVLDHFAWNTWSYASPLQVRGEGSEGVRERAESFAAQLCTQRCFRGTGLWPVEPPAGEQQQHHRRL